MVEQILEFDSLVWRKVRDAKLMEWVGDVDAVDWFLEFCQVCEVIDDLVDKDKTVEDSNITNILFSVFVEMPLNPFFDAHKSSLCPIMLSGINAWLDANALEQDTSDKKYRIMSYMLRDWYMELLAVIIYITRGRDTMRILSLDIRKFFMSESFDEYSKDEEST